MAQKIKQLIVQGEGTTAEFKESFDREAVETAGAFANTQGGVILVGVSDKSEIKGVSVGKETLRNWSNQISQATEPRVIPEVESAEIDGKQVAVIRIKEFPIKPVSVRGRCFRRVSGSNRVMTPQEIAQVHMASTGMSLDAYPFTRATTDDIDWESVRRYIEKANETGRRKIPSTDAPKTVLEKLELIKEGQPTFAAILLFGSSPQQKLSQATVHCGRFRQETIIIDDLLVSGTLMDQIDAVMDFIRKNINVEFVMTGEPQRKQVWDYPIPALREAVINAVCHRDYSENTDIQLKIHDDRLTIWSPGGLPHGVTLNELFDPNHSSKPRNKLIAQVFYEVELIERYGSGIGRILSACEAAGLPRPEFEEKFGGFLVVFRRDLYTEEYLRSLDLNERQIKAVISVREKGKITNKDYREMFGITDRTALRDLTTLCEKGVFEKMGQTGRSTEYVLLIHKPDKPDINPT